MQTKVSDLCRSTQRAVSFSHRSLATFACFHTERLTFKIRRRGDTSAEGDRGQTGPHRGKRKRCKGGSKKQKTQKNNIVERRAGVRSQPQRRARIGKGWCNNSRKGKKEKRKGHKEVGELEQHSKEDLLQYSPGEHAVVRGKHPKEDMWAEKQPSLLYY